MTKELLLLNTINTNEETLSGLELIFEDLSTININVRRYKVIFGKLPDYIMIKSIINDIKRTYNLEISEEVAKRILIKIGKL